MIPNQIQHRETLRQFLSGQKKKKPARTERARPLPTLTGSPDGRELTIAERLGIKITPPPQKKAPKQPQATPAGELAPVVVQEPVAPDRPDLPQEPTLAPPEPQPEQPEAEVTPEAAPLYDADPFERLL